MNQRKLVVLECGHQREVGWQKVGDTILCSEHGYQPVRIAKELPFADNRPRWSDGMATTGPHAPPAQ